MPVDIFVYFTFYCAMHFSAKRSIAILILSVCLSVSVCYIRDPWLNRLIFAKNNIQTNYPQEPGSLHYTAHQSNSREHLQFWLVDEGYVQKWHLRYKTSRISESSLEPNLLQSAYRNSCMAYRLVTNLVT